MTQYYSEEFKPEAGDVVSYCECEGVVRLLRLEGEIVCKFDESPIGVVFRNYGRIYSWEKIPALKFISRKKKKVKRAYWFVSYKMKSLQGIRDVSSLYTSKEHTDGLFVGMPDRQLHSIEIEEEE